MNEIGGVIAKVYPDTIAWETGLEEGDIITKINNQAVRDLIDFEYLWAEEEVELSVTKKSSGSEEVILIEKDYDEILGVDFQSAVFDGVRHCKNNCLFCFVDQMAPGMRESLYEKDDDYRLSFLQGNFITLTNLTEEDKKRIIEQRLSPLYVSVQSADEENRRLMLKNPQSVKIINDLQELTAAGIEFHTQIVLCKNINDGDFLEYSINKLESLGSNILSLAVVPVGITKYRKNQDLFPEFTKEESRDIIKKVHNLQKKFQEKRGYNFVYLGDELYIKGDLDFPEYDDYEGFPQLENGVGLSRIFIDEYLENKKNLPNKILEEKTFYLVSGKSLEKFLKIIVNELNKTDNLHLELRALENYFFGERVTVTGLLTGSDLMTGLKDIPKNSNVVIPDVMLKKGEELFLDNISVNEVESRLNIKIRVFDTSFTGLAEILFNNERGTLQ